VVNAVSCGGVVIYRNKVLLLYKNQSGRHIGWVLPKGSSESGESLKQTALREVKEETDVTATVLKYVGKTQYSFKVINDVVSKTVHWYLMEADSYLCRPQSEEFFSDAGFYKRHEAYHLLKFSNEKQMLSKAYRDYDEIYNDR